jgi:Fur family ferric uptake transcriptional regulator
MAQLHAGLRNAGRNKQIMDAIASLVDSLPQGTHLTAPEVHRRAAEAGLAVSLSTVYRALNNLQDRGNVTTLTGERGRRYEASHGHDHDHLICLRCGLTIEFVDDLIRGFGKTVAERKGFEHKSSRFDILGLCGDCKAQDEDHKIKLAMDRLQATADLAREAISLLEAALISHQGRKTGRATASAAEAAKKLSTAASNCNEAVTIFTEPGQ